MTEEKKTEGFDLSQLDTSAKSADGVEFELKHPTTGDPLDAYMTVCGQDSEMAKKARDGSFEKIQKRLSEDSRRTRLPSDNSDSLLEVAIKSVIEWRKIIDEGKPVKYSVPNVRKILEKYPFFVLQIVEAANDRSRFLPGDNG